MREDQLERSMRAWAPRVSTVDVYDRVASKRTRRAARRRGGAGAVAVAVVVAISGAFLLLRQDGEPARIAATGGPYETHLVTLDPDQGYVRGPLLVAGGTLSLSAYDRDGASFTYPPSRIVRVDARTFAEQGRTDLKAEIGSLADGEGARWAVTVNPPPANGLPDAFLKRIGGDGVVVSTLLPRATDPVGAVVAGAGGVWIPVRDGVLRFDPTTLRLTARYALAPADTRTVAISKDVVATDAGDLVALRPDGTTSGLCACTATGDPVVGLATSASGDLVELTRNRATGRTAVDAQPLPRRFAAVSLLSAGGRVWVQGTMNGSPAAVLVRRHPATVVLDGAHDASFAWVGDDTVLAVADGRLVRVDLNK
ncbi:MAG TPA: hypothetical protein VEP49_08465 [Acidimicrobiia bacterium]|nr:hypothetical protein [Acidimicrobiia bacterium]